jgi:hypothetical protein
MNDWEKVLLLGTDHVAIPPEVRKFFISLGLDETGSDPAFMRLSLAMHVGLKKISDPDPSFVQREKSGDSSKKWNDDPLQSEGAIFSFQQMNFLKSICRNNSIIEVHLAFFDYLRRRQLMLPTILLPALFDLSCKDPRYFSKLRPLISENGYLLLQKNKDWKSLLPVRDENLWYLGTFQERYSLLTYLCSQNPEAAMDLLIRTWGEDHRYDKIQFLDLFEKMDVLPNGDLLRLTFEENDSEIIIIITRIRCKLTPQDEEVVQLKNEIGCCIRYSEQGLHINLPEKWPEGWSRLGIHPEGEMPFTASKKILAFSQALSLPEPSHWSNNLQITPVKFLEALIKESYDTLFLPRLIHSILHYRDEEWAYSMLQHGLEHPETSHLIYEVLPTFLEIISIESTNRLIQAFLKPGMEPIEKDHFLFQLLLQPYVKWSDPNFRQLQVHLESIWKKYLSRGFFAFPHYESLFLLHAKIGPINRDGEAWLTDLEISDNQPSLFAAYLEVIRMREELGNILQIHEKKDGIFE